MYYTSVLSAANYNLDLGIVWFVRLPLFSCTIFCSYLDHMFLLILITYMQFLWMLHYISGMLFS